MEKGYVLRRGAQTVGLSERRGERTRHYVVSFGCARVARKVLHWLHPEPTLRLERARDDDDITEDVQSALAGSAGSAAAPAAAVVINTSGRLYLPKMDGCCLQPANDGGFHLHEMPEHDVYMLPFTRNLGVLLPRELVSEDAREMVFDCSVIEPCEDTILFMM